MPSNFNSKVVTQGLHRLDRAGFDRLLAEAPPAAGDQRQNAACGSRRN